MPARRPATEVVRRSYRIEEVAASLGVSEGHVRALIGDGSLPSVRLGRSVLILASDLDAFIDRLKAANRP